MKNLLLIITALLLLISCSNDKNNESQKSDSFFSSNHYGGTLNEGTTTIFTGFLPYVSKGISSERAISLIYSTLFKIDDNRKIKSDIVKEYNIENNKLIIEINTNISWHDGKSLTLDDVLLSLKIAKDKKIIDKDTEFKIIDSSNKIEIKFKEKPDLKQLVSVYILPTKYINSNNYNLSPLILKPIGSGPYSFLKKESNVVYLEIFKNYSVKRANFDQYHIHFYKNHDELLKNIEKDEINFIYNEEVDLDNFKKIELDSNNRQVIIFNDNSKLFKSVYFRKKFIEDILSIFKDKNNNIYKSVESFTLKENCPDEKISDKKIKRASIRLLVPDNNIFLIGLAKEIKARWQKQGINIKLIKKPSSEILYFMSKGLKSDVVFLNWQNFDIEKFIKFFKTKKNIFNLDNQLEDKLFFKEIICRYYSSIISKSIIPVYYSDNLENIKVINNKLNNPSSWFFSN
jgi:ABC-type transport system substrate-binding protein